MRALLDINVLIALIDPCHVFHDRAHLWLEKQLDSGIATCPIVENGFIRILSHPNYSKTVQLSPGELVRRLLKFTSSHNHEFIHDDVRLLDGGKVDATLILGSKQITDIYLLALAADHQMKLATFDTGIQLAAARNALPSNLEQIL
jgi:toxin-antitoxin system PIN domain toxin